MWLVIALKNNIQSLYSTGIPHPICMDISSSICSRSYISLDVVIGLFACLFVSISFLFFFSLNVLVFRPGDLRTEGKQLAHRYTVALLARTRNRTQIASRLPLGHNAKCELKCRVSSDSGLPGFYLLSPFLLFFYRISHFSGKNRAPAVMIVGVRVR